jgi:hypothetical protein
MTRKRKAIGSVTVTLTPQDAPDKPGYYFLCHPWSSFNGPVDVRQWGASWQVFVVGSLYPLRSSQNYSGAKWYFLGEMMDRIAEAHDG